MLPNTCQGFRQIGAPKAAASLAFPVDSHVAPGALPAVLPSVPLLAVAAVVAALAPVQYRWNGMIASLQWQGHGYRRRARGASTASLRFQSQSRDPEPRANFSCHAPSVALLFRIPDLHPRRQAAAAPKAFLSPVAGLFVQGRIVIVQLLQQERLWWAGGGGGGGGGQHRRASRPILENAIDGAVPVQILYMQRQPLGYREWLLQAIRR